MANLPPCGIGGQAVGGGPCSGTYRPSQAGQDAFKGIDSHSTVSTLIAAGAILAGVIFVVWIVATVAGFFGKEKPKPDDALKADADGWVHAHMRDFDYEGFGREYSNVRGAGDDMEADVELDDEDDSPLELAHDVEDKAGADLSDDEYDAAEWREEYRREHEGDL